MLAGIVEVAIDDGGNLTLTGSNDEDHVQVSQGDEVGVFTIAGVSGTRLRLAGSDQSFETLEDIRGIVGDITVDLGDDQDTFELIGGGVNNDVQSRIQGSLTIINGEGDENFILDAYIPGDLQVTSEEGGNDLTIERSTILGYTEVVNGDGGTSLTIKNSDLHGRGRRSALEVTNGAGMDVLTINDDSQFGSGEFVDSVPVIKIDNGDGAAMTTITGTSDQPAGRETTTIYGDIVIENGRNEEGFTDVLQFSSVRILGGVSVDNNAGSTVTRFVNTEVGANLYDIAPSHAEISNDLGFDTFTATASTFRWGLVINNDSAAEGGSNYGSNTTLTDTDVNPSGSTLDDGFVFYGDRGDDNVQLSGTTVRGFFTVDLYAGADEVSLLSDSYVDHLVFDGDRGEDRLIISGSAVHASLFAEFGEDDDYFEITNVDEATQWPDDLLGYVFYDMGEGFNTKNFDAFSDVAGV